MDTDRSFGSRGYELVVVANRLPVDHTGTGPDGAPRYERSPGGLVTALEPVMQRNAGAWVGWPGHPGEVPEPFDIGGTRIVPVPLSADEIAAYYEGFANGTLWPLYHDVIAPPRFHRRWWEVYVTVNERFAAAAAAQAAPGAVVWVQDYQLQLVPAMVRMRRPDVRIGFFNHIPFPGYEIFSQLPWRRQVLDGVLGADLVGFQRQSDATNFLRACRRAAGLPTRGSRITVPGGRTVRASAFPISIDAEALDALARGPEVVARARQIREDLGSPRHVLLGVDRLDYTKGLIHRLKAFAELLEDGEPTASGAVLVTVASPSRERVEAYRRLRDEVEVLVGRINGDHGALGQHRVHYLHQNYDRAEIAALFLAADVMLVTPLRDGMNLVAKEYVAARHDEDGVLVLSEFAGAAAELQQALLVNPHDIAGLKAAIVRALQLPAAERRRRMRALRRRVREYNVARWARDFLGALRAASDGGDSGPGATEAGEDPGGHVAEDEVDHGEVTEETAVTAETAARGERGGDGMVLDLTGPAAGEQDGEGGPPALPPALDKAVAAFAVVRPRLVALDFDGVCSPIVPRPEDARMLPATRAALERLVTADGVSVALISGRSIASLRTVAEPPDGVLLVGSHGAEVAGRGSESLQPLDASAVDLRERLVTAVEGIVAAHPGTTLETKPTAVVLHTRQASRGVAAAAVAAAESGPVAWPGVRSMRGKEVVELAVVEADKGRALRQLRAATGATAVLYAGDDVTDENAFAVLDDDAGDLTVKVGGGESVARHRIAGPEELPALLVAAAGAQWA